MNVDEVVAYFMRRKDQAVDRLAHLPQLERDAVELFVQKIEQKWTEDFFYTSPVPAVNRKKQRWLAWCDKHRPNVRDRLLRLNPEDGPEPGAEPNGWNPKRSTSYYWRVLGLVPITFYRKRWSCEPASINKFGRRKFVTYEAYLEGPNR